MSNPLSSRCAAYDRRAALRGWSLAVVAGLSVAITAELAAAQKSPDKSATDKSAVEMLRQHDQELEALRGQQKQAQEAEKKLAAEIAAVGEDRRKLNQNLIDTAARMQEIESRIGASETKLRELAQREDQLRSSLSGRRRVITEVLAALQRMGQRPPPALMVRPEDALVSVRTAMMLGAVLPDMRSEVESLATHLADLVQVRADGRRERESLGRDFASLADDRTRMSALVAERQKRLGEAEQALEGERQRAQALARQAGTLADLIAKLEQGLDSASRAARRGQSGPDSRGDFAALKDPGRLGPAVAFAQAKGMLRRPVNGVKLRDFGEEGSAGTEKGLSVATRAGAQVTAPCDGWVMYAAPYRSYGQLLILNAGGGYHVLLAGMERISVEIGQFVLTGEPVAAMGSGPQVASAALSGTTTSGTATFGTTASEFSTAGQPVLYIEFRKDGSPVDPTPWWATTETEKVRG
jgi:septal ring factor EnvC (AmiA/AmiB activator)